MIRSISARSISSAGPWAATSSRSPRCYGLPEASEAQATAIGSYGTGVWDRLGELTQPVLVANGAHDVMVPAFASYAMSQRLPNAKVILYSDAGHGFLFQHADEFGHEVLRFLA